MIDFPIIDSHIHLLDQKRFGYAWSNGAPALKRDWTPDDLAASARPYEIEGFVFVEVDVDMPQYLDEAEWVDEPRQTGPPRARRRRLSAARAGPGDRAGDRTGSPNCRSVRGVRRLIQNQPDPEYVLQPGFLEALRLLPQYGLSFDVCIFHHADAEHAEDDARLPGGRLRPRSHRQARIKAGLLDPWREHIREMAALPNVVCKLSGVTTEADHKAWTPRRSSGRTSTM